MTARAALTVVGQVAGAWIGGPLGSAIGGVIGSFVGGAIDGPVRNQQSLIEDLGAIKFDYGTPWPRIYGVYRMPVTPLWSSEKRPVAHEEEVDAKGGPSAVNTSYTYEMDWLCAAPLNAIGFSRIWVNGELKYSKLTESDDETISSSLQTTAWGSITFFDGNASQMPWSIYEASVGTANASAYRHRPTIAFESLDLGGSGQPPLVAVEFYTAATTAPANTRLMSYFDDEDSTDISAYENGAGTLSGATLEDGALVVNHNTVGAQTLSYLTASIAGDATSSVVVECIVEFISTPNVSYVRVLGWHPNNDNSDRYHFGFDGSSGCVVYDTSAFGTQYISDDPPAFPAALKLVFTSTGRHFFINGELVYSEVGGFPALGAVGRLDLGDPIGYEDETSTHYKIREFAIRFYEDDASLDEYTPGDHLDPPDGNTATPQPADLSDIVRSEALLTWTGENGLLDGAYLDTDELEGTEVTGYATTGSPIEAIAGLADVYYFGMSCAGDLKAVVRGGASVKTIPFDETGSGLDNPAEPFCGVGRRNDIEVPIQVSVTGPNYLTDYENGTETSDRLIGESVAVRTYNTAVVFTPAERKGRAETMVLDGRIGTNTAQLALDDTHVDLEPCDVVTAIDDEGNSYRLRIERETYSDSGRVFDVVLDDSSVLSTSGITAATDQRAITVRLPDPTESVLLDVPIFRDVDNDPGFYAVVHGNAQGASLLQSDDDTSFAEAATFSTESVFGTCTTTLGDWTGGVVRDETSSVTVDVGEGTLTSTTNDAMLASRSRNLALIGVHGRWEAVQFRTATLVSPGVYTLTGFLRGRFGTEWASVDHEADETFVLMTTSARRILKSTSDIGDEDFYKVVSVGQSIGAVDSEAFTAYAVGLKPYAPVHLRSSVDTSNNIVLTWERRTRLACTFTGTAGVSVPLGEASESYSIDVVSDDVVLRTITASTNTCSYTASQQSSDGVDDATDLRFDVYQVSDTVGRGYVCSLDGVGSISPQPQITELTVGGTFASGANLYATLGGVTYSYTSVGGDTNLAGIATSFAAVIDAASAYTASAVGAVITVTGQTSVSFPVVVGVSAGDNTATWALTQTASPTVAGVSNKFNITWLNMSDPAGSNAYPLGTLFSLLVQRISPALNLFYSYDSTPSGRTDYTVRSIVAAAIASDVYDSGDDDAYGFSIVVDPAELWTLNLYTPASEPYNWTVQASASSPVVSGLVGNTASGVTPATLRPQIVTLTLAGTVTTGWIYRATLGGVNYDYTATGGDTTMTHIATGLAAVIDAAASYLASSSGAVITITHASNNVSFTYSASIIASTVTLSYNTTQEAA